MNSLLIRLLCAVFLMSGIIQAYESIENPIMAYYGRPVSTVEGGVSTPVKYFYEDSMKNGVLIIDVSFVDQRDWSNHFVIVDRALIGLSTVKIVQLINGKNPIHRNILFPPNVNGLVMAEKVRFTGHVINGTYSDCLIKPVNGRISQQPGGPVTGQPVDGCECIVQ